jgi:hypothetical protein
MELISIEIIASQPRNKYFTWSVNFDVHSRGGHGLEKTLEAAMQRAWDCVASETKETTNA